MNTFVGCCRMAVLDESKDLTFPALVLYPTQVPSAPVAFGPFSLDVSLDAPIEEGVYPLVIISHGSGASHLTHRSLAACLAADGFVVCIPEHPFDNRNNNEKQYTINNMVDRPRHIRLAIDRILSDGRFNSYVKSDSIGVIGHSVGGYTALALAGGLPHTQFLVDFSQQPENQHIPWCAMVRKNKLEPKPIEVTADDRVKAVVLLAPDASLYVAEGALSKVAAPVLMLMAEKDAEVPAEAANVIIKGLPESTPLSHRVVENASHYSFLSTFPEPIKSRAGEVANDPPGFDRDKFQQELGLEVSEFLRKTL